jgi:TonB family protein
MRTFLYSIGFLLLMICNSSYLFAQAKNNKVINASFPGGEYAQAKFIADNIKLLQSVLDGMIGSVFVRVQVDETGELSNPKIVKSFNKACNEEALRIIALMPKWNAALKNNTANKTEVLIKIPFYQQRDFEFQYKRAIEYFEVKKYGLAYISIQEALRRFPDNLDYQKLESKICSLLIKEGQTCESLRDEFSKVDKEAMYPGGENEIIQFISKNTRYPRLERENGVDGNVMVTYIVDEFGNVIDVDIIKSVSLNLDNESIKVVSSFPTHTPAMKDGIPVPKRYTVPISYKIM